MKKVLYGIALILFAMLLVSIDPWIPFINHVYGLAFMIGFVGLVIAGIGAFTKDQ